jgi:hypothetical protein
VAPKKTDNKSRINEINESERVIESSVTCLIEREAAEGIKRKSTAKAMIPWNTRSRKMPFSVIFIMLIIKATPLHYYKLPLPTID